MKLFYFILLTLFFNANLTAKIIEKESLFTSFKEAQESTTSFLSFQIKSTKIGIFSSNVDGFVKKFKFKSDFDNKTNQAKDTEITFNVEDLDTDSSGRNEKMHEHCLAKSVNPTITVKLMQLAVSTGEALPVDAVMNIRGKDKTVKLQVTINRKENHFLVEGSGETKFSELEIPDPSIAIAKVDDTIKLKFKFEFDAE